MNLGRTVFAQLVDFLPTYLFRVCVERYQGNRYDKDFSCWDQFLILDQLLPEPGAIYLPDRGYLEFARLYVFTQACAFFVTRARKDAQFCRRYSRPVERSAGLRCDQTILLTGVRRGLDHRTTLPAPLPAPR